MLQRIRDHELVKNEYKEMIDYGIEALKTKNDQLFEKSFPKDSFRGFPMGYAWDVFPPLVRILSSIIIFLIIAMITYINIILPNL